MKAEKQGAVLYDFFRVAGGAERVSLDLASRLAADLYIGYDRPDIAATLGYEQFSNVFPLDFNAPGQALSTFRLIHGFLNKTQFLNRYSWVVYSGNFAPLAITNHSQGKNVLYCHALPRFIYDLKDFYEENYSGWRKPFLHTLIKFLQPRYESAIDHMDILIANSANVQKRIHRYLGKESIIVHPPCSIEDKTWLGQDGYYLSLARVEPYKRVDRLVEAFQKMPDKKLVVASGGSDLARLRELAGNASNIHFTGWVDELQLKQLIGNAIATLYIPRDEDFGMSPVESMAAGKPVIGVREGGLLETVVHDETGILMNADPQVNEIIAAVKNLTEIRARDMREVCEIRAQLFSPDIFYRKMKSLIEE